MRPGRKRAGRNLDCLCVRGRAGEILHARIRRFAPRDQAVELRGLWSAPVWLEADGPTPVERIIRSRDHRFFLFGQGARSRFGRLAKDNERGSIGSEMQRDCRTAAGDGIRGQLRLAARRIPQFRRFSVHAEDRIHSFRTIRAIIDKINLAIRKFAVHEHQVRVGFGPGVFKVARQAERGQHLVRARACVHSSLARAHHAVIRRSLSSPELIRNALKLRFVVGEAGRIRGPVAHHHRALRN